MEIEDILKYTLTLFQDIDKRLSELRNQQSIWDIKQDELLHYIENHNIEIQHDRFFHIIIAILEKVVYTQDVQRDQADYHGKYSPENRLHNRICHGVFCGFALSSGKTEDTGNIKNNG